MKIALLAGGDSTEYEVSQMTAAEIEKTLDPQKYIVTRIDIKPDDHRAWIRLLMDAEPDLAVLALHGGTGENGAVQGLLECLHIPYVGSKILGSALCLDKVMSKSLLRAHHIPVVEDVVIPNGAAFDDYASAVRRLGLPLVVKPSMGGSSVGVIIVQTWDEVERAVADVSMYGDDLLIEQFIPGAEVTCGVIETSDGTEVLPVVDIEAADGFYDYEAKYLRNDTKIERSALPVFLRDMIGEISKQAFAALYCKGYARVDMIIRDEQIYVLEVNTLPGMTSHSLFPKAASLAGMDFGALLDRLIDFEMSRP